MTNIKIGQKVEAIFRRRWGNKIVTGIIDEIYENFENTQKTWVGIYNEETDDGWIVPIKDIVKVY